MKILKNQLPVSFLALGLSLMSYQAQAQLSTNSDKFLGNITTRGKVNATGYEYATLVGEGYKGVFIRNGKKYVK